MDAFLLKDEKNYFISSVKVRVELKTTTRMEETVEIETRLSSVSEMVFFSRRNL